jgi:purine nucleosidase
MFRLENSENGEKCQLEGWSRRTLLHGAVAGSLAGFTAGQSSALTASPRQRVILDNDFSGDPDGLFQLAHHLTSRSVEVSLVVGSHIHVNDFLDKSVTQADNAVTMVREVYSRMKLARVPMTIAGRNFAPSKGAKALMTASSRHIIQEAMRTDTKLPLFYCAGAGLTEIAEAVKLEPAIANQLKLIWISRAWARLLPFLSMRP